MEAENMGLKMETENNRQMPGSPAASEASEISSIVSSLKEQMDFITKNVISREEAVLQSLYAVLMREHLLLLGRTGMAKSYLAGSIFSIFDDIKVFSTQASKDQTPDNYFGPYNIEEFKKGVIKHNSSGSIIEADMVFLDEFFDASDIVLRALLTVLNERKFINGPEKIDAAVHTAIATANYMRLNEVTEAVLDRFIFKSIIPEDSNMYIRLRVDESYASNKGEITAPENKIPFVRMKYLSDIVRNKNHIKINIPDHVLFMKNVIINNYEARMRSSDNAFFISPRKQAKMSDLLRASAILSGRFEVIMNDIRNIYLSVCTLNSSVPDKKKNKTEKELFLESLEQTMVHFNTMGALEQIEYLLNIRNIFKDIVKNPEKAEELKRNSSAIQKLKNLFLKIFKGQNRPEENLSIPYLKSTLHKLNPALMEVRELKEGILKEFRDLNE